MLAVGNTFEHFLEEAAALGDSSSAEVRALLVDLAAACKAIGRRLANAPLRSGDSSALDTKGRRGRPGIAAADGGCPFGTEGRRAWIARSRSGTADACRPNAGHLYRGRHLAVLLPVDSPSNVAANMTVGTIFSILRIAASEQTLNDNDVLQANRTRVCSGYAIHGPSLVFVLALGQRVQAFTLDRQSDEFVLTHSDLRVPAATDRIAIDVSRMRSWTPPIRRYVDECLAGEPGCRGKDFQVRWLGSTVAETHRILTGGGVFISPGRAGRGDQPCPSWLSEEASPLSFVIERAGGRASTGTTAILDIRSSDRALRPSLIFGSVEEVERIESYHASHDTGSYDAPLFGERGLFRSSV